MEPQWKITKKFIFLEKRNTFDRIWTSHCQEAERTIWQITKVINTLFGGRIASTQYFMNTCQEPQNGKKCAHTAANLWFESLVAESCFANEGRHDFLSWNHTSPNKSGIPLSRNGWTGGLEWELVIAISRREVSLHLEASSEFYFFTSDKAGNEIFRTTQ